MFRVWGASGLRCGAVLVALSVVTGCGRGGEGPGSTDTSAGEVSALNYEVTQDRYDRWVAAQQALDAIPGLPGPPKIDPLRLGEPDIRRAVEYLESDARVRSALQRAGISARDYVLTTVALDQALVTAVTTPTPTGAAPSAPVANRPAASGGAGTVASRPGTPARPRLRGTPERNVELVRRNRADVVRVLRTMRFRVSEPPADDLVAADTSVTRSDSVSVGKGVTVKWDVTVRRTRDTTAATKAPAAPRDSVRRDSTPD